MILLKDVPPIVSEIDKRTGPKKIGLQLLCLTSLFSNVFVVQEFNLREKKGKIVLDPKIQPI